MHVMDALVHDLLRGYQNAEIHLPIVTRFVEWMLRVTDDLVVD